MEVKETVRALLDRLPDDCTIEEVLYHLYVLNAVACGQVEADRGEVILHEQVAESLRRKRQLGVK